MLRRLSKHLTAKADKRGQEYVEAAFILPVLILTIFSMIYLCIYYYEAIANETAMHKEAIKLVMKNDYTFNIKTKNTETSKSIKGLIDTHMGKKSECRVYTLNEAKIIRAGEMVDFDE